MSIPVPGPAIKITGLSKRFGRLDVFRDMSLTLAPARVTALIGPNAAGKSTLLKCLLGLCRPDAGTIRIGPDIAGQGDEYRRRIGYMPQMLRFPEHLTGREVVEMLKGLREPGAPVDTGLFDQLQLARELDKPVRTLSGGTRQKLNAALAFLFESRLLILDEPTAGLDPVAAGILKEKVQASRRAGATVIITSHVIAELEEMTEDVVLLLDGGVRFHGPLAEVRRRTGEHRLERAIAQLMLGVRGAA